MPLFEPTLATLNRAGVRYVVVGGVATVLQGFARMTADLDLIVDLSPGEAEKAIRALTGLGLRPRAPVPAESFAAPEARKLWAETKGMTVFSMWNPSDPFIEVDLFLESPVAFDELWARSEVVELSTTRTRIASIPDLIALKTLAGRPEDQQDIEALQHILRERGKR